MAKTKKPQLPKVVFSEADFKMADRFGKMYMKLIQPMDFDLNDRDERYYRWLCRLYPMIAEGQPRRKIIAAIVAMDGGIWKDQAVGMINDAEKLFANVGKSNRKLQRWVQREELLELIQLVKEEFLTKELCKSENEDGQIVEAYYFKVEKELVLTAIEQIRRLRADIAKLERLDQPDDDTEGDELPEVGFDDKHLEAELAEYEEIAKNTIHLQT